MFRRVACVPRISKAASSRLFSSIPSQPDGAQIRTRRVRNFLIFTVTTYAIVPLYCVYKILQVRQYVTDEDMHEYRSQKRNVYRCEDDYDTQTELLVLFDMHQQHRAIAKRNKASMSTEDIATNEKEVWDKFWAWGWGLYDLMHFYCTYEERVERLKRAKPKDAKNDAKRAEDTGI